VVPLLVLLAVALPLSAQPNAHPNARELVRQSIRNGEQAWKNSFSYFCTKEDIDRERGPSGNLKSVSDNVYDVHPLGYHTSFDLLVKQDNEPVSAAQRAKEEKELRRRQAASPADKQDRFQKQKDERSYMLEVPQAFDFRITGTANLPTGPAWVVVATPHPGYQPVSRYARMFHAMQGTLWIDQKSLQWVKADAVAMSTVSFGFFIARLYRGSHIIIEQQRLSDGDWVPKRIQAHAAARLFLFINHRFEEDITYTNYRKATAIAGL
jgi:hypothetical protein